MLKIFIHCGSICLLSRFLNNKKLQKQLFNFLSFEEIITHVRTSRGFRVLITDCCDTQYMDTLYRHWCNIPNVIKETAICVLDIYLQNRTEYNGSSVKRCIGFYKTGRERCRQPSSFPFFPENGERYIGMAWRNGRLSGIVV